MLCTRRNAAAVFNFVLVMGGSGVAAPHSGAPTDEPLVTGRKITVTPGARSQDVGSLPINMVPGPDGRYAIVTDIGWRESLWSIRTSDGRGISHVDFPNRGPNDPRSGLYYGLAVTPAGTVYAAQGADDTIAVLTIDPTGKLALQGRIRTRRGDFPSGLAVDARGLLYVANNSADSFLQPGSIAIFARRSGAEVGRYEFRESFGGTPNFPLAIAVLRDGSKLYVASQRDGAVYVLDTHNPGAPSVARTLKTGPHPAGMLLNRARSQLYVAMAGSDTVARIDTATDKIVSSLGLLPPSAGTLNGATPTGMALSPDEATLYVALSDLNAIAVVDTAAMRVRGYIPAGWYPTAVAVSPDGNTLLAANGKGLRSRNPNPGYERWQAPGRDETDRGLQDDIGPSYVLNILEGAVAAIPRPDVAHLRADSQVVLANARLTVPSGEAPRRSGLPAGAIEHVIYVVKENRTYDQVLGDLPAGRGDSRLAMFPQEVTPNQHALASRFVLLDNFYDNGEVSGDGWSWSTGAIANEYVSKTVPYNYSGRGRNYDYEGQNNGYPTGGFPAADPDGKPLSTLPTLRQGAPAVPDVSEGPSGRLWDAAIRANVSFRNYGFFYSFGLRQNGQTVVPDNYPAAKSLQPPGHDLAGVSDFDFRRFDLDYPDSDAAATYHARGGAPDAVFARSSYGIHKAQSRFAEWQHEFQLMLAKDPTGSAVPALMTIRFPNDHTAALAPGKHTPRSLVADNDYAVGELVQAVSRSPIWKSTAIFIIEDDAQDGPDHIDAHRSTCYVASPWIRPHMVDHRFYNTTNVLHTIELLLGMEPLTLYDAHADPIGDWDIGARNDAPFSAALPPRAIVAATVPPLVSLNPKSSLYRLASVSASLDFNHPDSAPAGVVNRILWQSTRTLGSEKP